MPRLKTNTNPRRKKACTSLRRQRKGAPKEEKEKPQQLLYQSPHAGCDSTLLSPPGTPVHLPFQEGDDKPECYIISQLTIHTSR